jgi:hypothetical protein
MARKVSNVIRYFFKVILLSFRNFPNNLYCAVSIAVQNAFFFILYFFCPAALRICDINSHFVQVKLAFIFARNCVRQFVWISNIHRFLDETVAKQSKVEL